jgi:hypothetical protein
MLRSNARRAQREDLGMSPKLLRSATIVVLMFGCGTSAKRQPEAPEMDAAACVVAAGFESERVRDGTPLCSLIRANQDFDAWLCLGETENDRTRLPRWLRTYWRKAHASRDCVDHVYPQVLFELYEWMLAHQDLLPDERAQNLTGTSISPGTAGTISGRQKEVRSESDIRISFASPTSVIAAANSGQEQVQFSSGDSGGNWSLGVLPLKSVPETQNDIRHADPALGWVSDVSGCGTAFAVTVGLQVNPPLHYLRSFTSTNCGVSWKYEATPSAAWQTAVDKPAIWSGPSSQNVYAIYNNLKPLYVVTRSGGRWGTPVPVSVSGSTLGADITSNSRGEVFAFWRTFGLTKQISVAKSTDGGTTFSAPSRIAPVFGDERVPVPAAATSAPLIYVSAGTFGSNIYASWSDMNGNSDCDDAQSEEPSVSVISPCTTRIWLAKSANDGANWTYRKLYDRPLPLSDQFNQRLAVDPVSGIVGIIYYDSACDPSRRKTCVTFQFSTDNGTQWSDPETITTAPSDETGAADENQYGDYNGFSAYNSKFIASWTDSSQGLPEQIWSTSRCVYPGPPVGLTAALSGQQVILAWSAVAGATEYRVKRSSTQGGDYAEIGTTSSTTFVDGSVASGSVYYVVVAWMPCRSGNSNEASATVVR